jgi:hypothetical protein
MILLMLITIVSFGLMHAIEITSFGTRVAGRVSNRVALGTTLQQTIYTTSRFLLIPFLPTLGYLVESGINLNTYLLIVAISIGIGCLASIFMILRLNNFQLFYQGVFENYSTNTIPIAILKSFFQNNKKSKLQNCNKFSFEKTVFKKTFVSFLAYLFLITGFFIAFLLAIIFPENRLTLSQFTATFHGFGAVIFAFYLDPMLSRSIDNRLDDHAWLQNVYSILLGRAASYLVVLVFLVIYLLFYS